MASRQNYRSNRPGRCVRARRAKHRPSDLEKGFYIAAISFGIVLTALLAHGASYYSNRTPRISHFEPRTSYSGDTVFGQAMTLKAKYDSRPYWHGSKLTPGSPASREIADLAIEHLIPCESGGRAIDHMDSNGKMSYGILQFQDWREWERMSGISGDPENPNDAIRMAEWGIEHGMIDHWGCARILGEM